MQHVPSLYHSFDLEYSQKEKCQTKIHFQEEFTVEGILQITLFIILCKASLFKYSFMSLIRALDPNL